MVKEKKVLVVYFSGTGGAKRVADEFESSLKKRNYSVLKHSLDIFEYESYRSRYKEIINDSSLIVLIYAVYALDAPQPVYDWIGELPQGGNTPVAVISVSGGGEIWPNTSCRASSIKALERKGYNVPYEKMMVMPPNMVVKVSDHLVMHLLNSVSVNVERILDEVLAGKRCRSRFKISTRILLPLSKLERKNSKEFSKAFKVSEKCSACGWCQSNCPRGNIELIDNKPAFKEKCIICLRCIYGCPNKAIYCYKYKAVMFKDGYSLKEIEKKMQGAELEPVEKCCKGISLIGIKKYLLDR